MSDDMYPMPGRRYRLRSNPVRDGIVKHLIVADDPAAPGGLRVDVRVAWSVPWGLGGEDTWPAHAFEPIGPGGESVEILVSREVPRHGAGPARKP